jgi:hypothetical protein
MKLAEALTMRTEAVHRIEQLRSRTYASTPLGAGTITDAIAHRDVLRLRYTVITAAADAASGRDHSALRRQFRSELKHLAALPISELRSQADRLARDIRELEQDIQRINWDAELLD